MQKYKIFNVYKISTLKIFINNKEKLNTILRIKSKINTNVLKVVFLNKQKINVINKSKGKGFCGVIKKFNFSSNKASHGNSKSHNKPGSIGMCQDPGKVFKGKKMPGRKRRNKITVKNIKINLINENLILIDKIIPGSKKSKARLKIKIND